MIVGAPAYLASTGRPTKPDDLQHHACLRIRRSSGAIAPWRLVKQGNPIDIMVKGPLIANEFPTLLGAAREGLGLAQVPEPMAEEAITKGDLSPVLLELAPMTPGIFLYHPGRRQVLPKLRAFIEHVEALVAPRRTRGMPQRKKAAPVAR
jgi:DNA-binding transcriptional LysR family regulator